MLAHDEQVSGGQQVLSPRVQMMFAVPFAVMRSRDSAAEMLSGEVTGWTGRSVPVHAAVEKVASSACHACPLHPRLVTKGYGAA